MNSPPGTAVARWAGACAIVGAIGFVVIVIALHVLQAGYDPVHQLMSELALGAYGWAMLGAFLLMASSTLSVAIGIRGARDALLLQIVLGVATLGFSGAGIFTLERASAWHIALIAIAFVAVVLAMYLIPAVWPQRFGGGVKAVSWGLAAGTALSVFLGHSLIPIGVGQRLAGACVVIWLCFAGARLREE